MRSEEGWAGRLLDWFEGVMRQGEAGALPEAGGESGLFSSGAAAEEEAGPAGQHPPGSSGRSKGRKKSGGGGGGAAGQHKKGQQERPAGRQQQQQQQGQQLPAEVYSAVLDGTWGVLPLVSGPRRRALLGAVWALWERSGVRSAARMQVSAPRCSHSGSRVPYHALSVEPMCIHFAP